MVNYNQPPPMGTSVPPMGTSGMVTSPPIGTPVPPMGDPAMGTGMGMTPVQPVMSPEMAQMVMSQIEPPTNLSRQRRVEGMQLTRLGQVVPQLEVVEIEDWRTSFPHICSKGPVVVVQLVEENIKYTAKTNRRVKQAEIEMGTVMYSPDGYVLTECEEVIAWCQQCGKMFLQSR